MARGLSLTFSPDGDCNAISRSRSDYHFMCHSRDLGSEAPDMDRHRRWSRRGWHIDLPEGRAILDRTEGKAVMAVRFIIERHSSTLPKSLYWTGAGKKWSSDRNDAVMLLTRERADSIIKTSPEKDSAARPYTYTVEEETV